MSVGFIRRFTFDPGNAELTAIEGVVVIDREPPASITGVGSGAVLMVGEFENGPFAAAAGVAEMPQEVVEVEGAGDLATAFGGFGFTYSGVVSSNPCARSRKADGAVKPEFWNGNGFIALVNKKFRRLFIARVDTSVGVVSFTRLASLSGNNSFNYDLEPNQTVVFDIGAGSVTATFTAVAASKASAAGTYPSTFVGGETLTFAIEGVQYTATFLSTDSTQNQVIARLNAAAGYTAFANSGGNVTTLTGLIRGTSGAVQIVAVSGALVTTATGFSAGSVVNGTGNVGNIDQVTVAEANTVIHNASGSVNVDRDANGKIRIYNSGTPGTGSITVKSTSTAVAFGWATEVAAAAASGVDGVIPAGTVVQTAGAVQFVTMQTLTVTAANAGPYDVKVRHALDDGTGASQLVSTVVQVPNAIALGSFSVTNNLPINTALSEAAIDSAYISAISKTTDVASVAKQTNLVVSARGSNIVRNQLRQNALDASANGCFGRMACISPPLGTTRAAAKSTSAQPGVGAYRDQRVIYCFPGATTFVPQIASRGTSGGAGFTASGLIDTRFAPWVASLISQLNPEENPGQATGFINLITAVEAQNADVQGMTIDDYKAFRASGICALRIDDGDVFVQSGVTSVDPLVTPNLRNIARRRMADFIQDTLSIRLSSFVKKLNTKARRATMLGEMDAFMRGLVSANNPQSQRIDGYLLDGVSQNTPDTIAAGIYRVKLKVRTLSSLDSIVLDTEVGESVDIKEAA